jgi:hypothetical protein
MRPNEITDALATIPGLQVSVRNNGLRVAVSAISDSVRLDIDQVQRVSRIAAPTGDPALEFVLSDGVTVWPLIFAANDVVFAPEDSAAVLDSPIPYRVGNAPPLVAYSEMERDAESVAHRAERPGPINLSGLAGSFLLLRCLVAGAVRLGLRPMRTVAWWQRGWDALGGDLPIPPFRADPVWEELALEASPSP